MLFKAIIAFFAKAKKKETVRNFTTKDSRSVCMHIRTYCRIETAQALGCFTRLVFTCTKKIEP